ncbi:hypothetical protein N0V85_000460 [Neurospora sp. IMI 360204]|nr:hypothetical protein N0V85_000460 [Neurospora sp. IMI 360204]
MVLLTQLPSEIINNIFGYDEPPEDVDWEQSLNDLAKLRRLCGREYSNLEISCANIHMPKMTFVHHAVTKLLKAIPPSSSLSTRGGGSEHSTQQPVFSSYPPSRNAAILSHLFSKESVRNAFLQGSQLYERAHCFDYLPIPMRTIIDLERSRYIRVPVYIEYQQQSAKMHCLFGVGVQAPATLTLPNNPALSSSLNLNPYPPPTPGTNAHATPPSPPLPTRDGQIRSAFFGRTSLVPRLYPYAVSKVYDLREYTLRTKWGPFRADGSGKVDWEKMEAILLVLRTNIKLKELDRIPMVGNVWNTPFAGYYTDFFSFNFPDDNMPCPESMPRPPLDVGEATKLLMMKINVTRIIYPEPGTGHPKIKGKIWPIVHWKGYARSFDGSPGEARLTWGLRGVVQMTPEGEVRWTTSSLYDGEERWRSEGIQIGGIKSARGVIGNWFDKDYNPHGPCGPTAFWKISDLEAVRGGGATNAPSVALLIFPLKLAILLPIATTSHSIKISVPTGTGRKYVVFKVRLTPR